MKTLLRQIGPYRIVRKIAEGGFAHVFLCADAVGRQVCVKLHTFGEERRFRYEAETMRRFRRPDIVRVYDCHRDPGTGRLFTVMEYVPFPTLASVLMAQPSLGEALTVNVLRRTAVALQHVYTHSSVTAHRDIKPANIFVHLDGERLVELKVTDFGIARTNQGLGTFATMGDPEFSAPEQIEGKNHLYGAVTDIYALGCLAFRMLSGHPVFGGDTRAQLDAHTTLDGPPLENAAPGVNRRLCAIVNRCLKRDAMRRFQSMPEFIHALDAVAGAEARAPTGEEFVINGVPPRGDNADIVEGIPSLAASASVNPIDAPRTGPGLGATGWVLVVALEAIFGFLLLGGIGASVWAASERSLELAIVFGALSGSLLLLMLLALVAAWLFSMSTPPTEVDDAG